VPLKASVQLRNGADELEAPRVPASDKNAVPRAEIGGSLPGEIQDQALVFEEKRQSDDGSRSLKLTLKEMHNTENYRDHKGRTAAQALLRERTIRPSVFEASRWSPSTFGNAHDMPSIITPHEGLAWGRDAKRARRAACMRRRLHSQE
jgi:hypothetical protein